MNTSGRWLALDAATRCAEPRLPFTIAGRAAGSVAIAHLPALPAFGAILHVDKHRGIDMHLPRAERNAAFVRINAALRAQGLIPGWRNEVFAVPDLHTQEELARMERAAARFWGTLTFGAHATGYVAGSDGRPEALWIAQRAFDKTTDPGRFDNLIGGGVPAGQTPAEALVREGFEEAGLSAAEFALARPAGVLRLARDIAEGFQREWLYSFDLELPPGRTPVNQDGEVAAFTLMPVPQALALAAAEQMTVDAALVTIDFALRHGLVDDPSVSARIRTLRVGA